MYNRIEYEYTKYVEQMHAKIKRESLNRETKTASEGLTPLIGQTRF